MQRDRGSSGFAKVTRGEFFLCPSRNRLPVAYGSRARVLLCPTGGGFFLCPTKMSCTRALKDSFCSKEKSFLCQGNSACALGFRAESLFLDPRVCLTVPAQGNVFLCQKQCLPVPEGMSSSTRGNVFLYPRKFFSTSVFQVLTHFIGKQQLCFIRAP